MLLAIGLAGVNALRAEGEGLAACWVCTQGERLLGMIGVEPVRLQAGEQGCDAQVTMDIMVRPELDGVGLGVGVEQAHGG